MRRFPSGTTDQYIYFVAVDATDLKTRETGLSSFTVYRARNGAAAAAYTTPTIAEVSSSNMPGVYSLLLDEDMTLAAGNSSEEVVLHITQASMAPVTLIFEIYRPIITEGQTLTVASSIAQASVQSIAADAITAASIAADAGTEIATAVWAAAARTLTALDEDSTTIDLDGVIQAAVDARFDTVDTSLSLISGFLDTEIAAIKAVTDNLNSTVWDATDGIETGISEREALRIMAAVIAGDLTFAGTTWTFKGLTSATDRLVATVDGTGRDVTTVTP